MLRNPFDEHHGKLQFTSKKGQYCNGTPLGQAVALLLWSGYDGAATINICGFDLSRTPNREEHTQPTIGSSS